MAKKIIERHGVGTVDNNPRLPAAKNLEYGELAVNYTDGNEAIAFKNVNNEIVVINSAAKNESSFLSDINEYFKSYNTVLDYTADANEHPTISWIEESQELKYEIDETEEESPYNLIFDRSKGAIMADNSMSNFGYVSKHLDIKYNIMNIKVMDDNGNWVNPFTTFQINGIEMVNFYQDINMNSDSSDTLAALALIQTDKPHKAYVKVKTHTIEEDNEDDITSRIIAHAFSYSSMTYAEVDESFQKMLYSTYYDSYIFTLGYASVYLREVKMVGDWIPKKGMSTYLSLIWLAYLMNPYITIDFKFYIPKDNTTYGNPDEVFDFNLTDMEQLTFYGFINTVNSSLEASGIQHRIIIETY
jgi:hypothetical protein